MADRTKAAPAKARALTKNAGDPESVKNAARVETDRERRFGIVMKTILALPEGRELIWLFLRGAGIYENVFHRDPGVMAFNAGRQNWGQKLLADVLDIDSEAYLVMEREARDRETREAAAIDAAQTPSAGTVERDDAP